MVVGAFAMHWLCYLPGSVGGPALGSGIHSYLVDATPLMLALCVGVVLLSLVVSYDAPRPRTNGRSFEAQASRYAAFLVAGFLAQELVELLVVGAGPQGADAVLGAGAWLVLPGALFTGLLAALSARSLDRVADRLAARTRPSHVLSAPSRQARPAGVTLRASSIAGLAFGFARRPPPAPLRV